jgi:acyl-homoserine lactone acylase PvdQ
MKEIVKKVKLLKPFDIDKITIDRDHYFRSAYIVDLPLDSTPDHVWQDIFEQKWKSSRHLWDRKLFVIGDKLRLVTTADEFEEKLDWIGQVINETNKAVEEYNRVAEFEEKTIGEVEKRKLWEERARIEAIKEALRRRFAQI